jgi:hypothetical protein
MENSAKSFGGATKMENGVIYSNFQLNEYIDINSKNDISLYIPSTINIDKNANKMLIKDILTNVCLKLISKYKSIPSISKSVGSWYSNELEKINELGIPYTKPVLLDMKWSRSMLSSSNSKSSEKSVDSTS